MTVVSNVIEFLSKYMKAIPQKLKCKVSNSAPRWVINASHLEKFYVLLVAVSESLRENESFSLAETDVGTSRRAQLLVVQFHIVVKWLLSSLPIFTVLCIQDLGHCLHYQHGFLLLSPHEDTTSYDFKILANFVASQCWDSFKTRPRQSAGQHERLKTNIQTHLVFRLIKW